jgi:streptogramin lyase
MVTTLAGLAGGTGTADGSPSIAQFNSPYGAVADAAGNTFIADTLNHTIRKMDASGNVTTLAGLAGTKGSVDGTRSAARFYIPYGLTVDTSGNVYVCDSGNNTIRKITPTGLVTTLAGLAGTNGTVDGTGNGARFYTPGAIAFNGTDTLIVADTGNDTIRKVSLTGVVTTFAGTPGVSGTADGLGTQAQFLLPYGVAIDATGNVVVADTYNNTVRKIDPAGRVTTLAGTPGAYGAADGQGSLARFAHPRGIVLDYVGNVYVSDYANHAIRKIDSAGNVTTLVGVLGKGLAFPGSLPAGLNYPWGLAITSNNDLIVTTTNGVMQATAP